MVRAGAIAIAPCPPASPPPPVDPPPLSPRRPAASAELVVHSLPPRTFALVWAATLSAHVACALFLLAASRVYLVLDHECMAYYANLLSRDGRAVFPAVAWICVAVSAGHGYAILKTLTASLRARALVFAGHRRAAVEPARADLVGRYSSALGSRRLPLPLLRRWTLADVYAACLGRQGFFGAESAFFESKFLLREAVEMAAQTAQVAQGSVLIGRPWINNALVALLFVNSWSTPAIQHLTRRQPALERVLCLATDLALDAATNVALPLLLLAPYYRRYDAANCTFDTALLYSDVGIVNFIMESRMVLVRGYSDLALKLAPHLSMLMCLRSIQSLLRPRHRRRRRGLKESAALVADASGPRAELLQLALKQELRARPPPGSRGRRSSLAHSLAARIRHMQRLRLRGHKATAVHAAFVLWGVLVLGIHVHTTFQATVASEGDPPGCVQPLRPWFTSRPACSVFRYSCLADNASSPVDASLGAIDALSLASLLLFDCANLHVSPMLRSFPNLMELEIWRSHIARWDRDAALTATSSPNLFYCGLIQSTMHEIPAGLRFDLPPALQDIEISHCNLSELPRDLDVAWAGVSTLYIESCALHEFPEAVARMEIDDLSLVGNAISAIETPLVPDNVFSLALSGNPIVEISDDAFPGGGQLTIVALEDTLLEDMPIWVQDVGKRAGGKVFARGTPFCTSKSPKEIAARFGASAGVSCIDESERSTGRYPLDLVIALRDGDNAG